MSFEKYNDPFSYRYGQLKKTGFWNMLLLTVKRLKPYFLISRIIRYTGYIIAIIETSAVLLVLSALLITALPILLLVFGVISLISISQYKNYDESISKDIDTANRIIIIEGKKGYFGRENGYLERMARSYRNEGSTVIVVSRSLKHDRFLVARKAEEGIWVIKLNYFYRIKKKFLKAKDNILTYIF